MDDLKKMIAEAALDAAVEAASDRLARHGWITAQAQREPLHAQLRVRKDGHETRLFTVLVSETL